MNTNISNGNNGSGWPINLKLHVLYKLFNNLPVIEKSRLKNYVFVFSLYDKRSKSTCFSYMDYQNIDGLDGLLSKNIQIKDEILNKLEDQIAKVLEFEEKGKTNAAIEIIKYLNKSITEYRQDKEELLNKCLEILFKLPFPYLYYEQGIIFEVLKNINRRKGDIPPKITYFWMKKADNKDNREVTIFHDGGGYENLSSPYSKEPEVNFDNKDFFLALKNLCLTLIKSINFSTEEAAEILNKECIGTPIYEYYFDSMKVGYGVPVGSIFLYYKNEIPENEKDSNRKNLEKILRSIRFPIISLANEVSTSNFLEIEEKFWGEDSDKMKIRDSFIEYFLDMIGFVQDFERIYIVKKKEETSKYTANDINFFWEQKSQENDYTYLPVWKDSQELGKLSDEERKNILNALKSELIEENPRTFELSLRKIEFYLEPALKGLSSDKKEEILNQHIICHYPAYTRLPDLAYMSGEKKKKASNDQKRTERLFNARVNEIFVLVFEKAIKIWQQKKATRENEKLRGYIGQMSHNLQPAIEKIKSNELAEYINPYYKKKGKCNEPIRERDNYILNPVTYDDGEIASSVGRYNFFSYLHSHLNYYVDFTEDPKGEESIFKLVNYFSQQKLLCKYLTSANGHNNDPEVTLNFPYSKIPQSQCSNICTKVENFVLLPVDISKRNAEKESLKVAREPFFMFLEGYLRNVAKHSGVTSETIACYVDVENSTVSIWEKSEKTPEPIQLSNYKKYKKAIKRENNEYQKLCILESKDKNLAVFYFVHKYLASLHELVHEEGPFSFRKGALSALNENIMNPDNYFNEGVRGGLSALHSFAYTMSGRRNTLKVIPVLVEANGKRNELDCDNICNVDIKNKTFAMEYQFEIKRK